MNSVGVIYILMITFQSILSIMNRVISFFIVISHIIQFKKKRRRTSFFGFECRHNKRLLSISVSAGPIKTIHLKHIFECYSTY